MLHEYVSSTSTICFRCKDSVKHYGLTSNGNQVGFGLATFDNVSDFKAHFTKQPFIAGESGKNVYFFSVLFIR